MSAVEGAPGSHVSGRGELGVRMALRTHSRRAVSAGTLLVLLGSVTVTCCRVALLWAKPTMLVGAMFRSPLSPIINPWLGLKELPLIEVARLPGPETLRMFNSK